jgi:hypothetical protein
MLTIEKGGTILDDMAKEFPSLVTPMEEPMSQMRMPSLMIPIGEDLPQL